MSKPMLVTVPFVLLLLDFWPLGRLQLSTLSSQPSTTPSPLNTQHSTLNTLLIEKLPFLALSAASCIVTFLIQRRGGAVASLELLTPGFRISNALISYVRYALKMVWPANLAVFYPAPDAWPAEWVAGAALVLAAVSALALYWARKAPWFAFGWFWYLGTLVPVIGILQVGHQAMADRYSYLPLIGLFVAIAWGGAAAAARWPKIRGWLAAGALAVLVVCGGLTWRQAGYWRSSASLFEHALAVTRDNFVAHNNLGAALMERGDVEGAERHFVETLRVKPYDPEAHFCLAAALTSQRKTAQAIPEYREALRLLPNYPDALNNLAWILAANPDPRLRNGREAVDLAERACQLTEYKQPLLVGTLAAAYAEAGRFTKAVATAEKARTLAEQTHQPDVAARNRALLELYRSGRPARDNP
jgi:Flp pilus assembly protein TadD